MLSGKSGFAIQHDEVTMLVRCTLGARSQTVKVTCRDDKRFALRTVRLESRACAARDYRFVLDALKLNADSEWGGLALNESTNPPTIDVIYNMVGSGIHPTAFAKALLRVASFADRIENLTSKSDRF